MKLKKEVTDNSELSNIVDLIRIDNKNNVRSDNFRAIIMNN